MQDWVTTEFARIKDLLGTTKFQFAEQTPALSPSDLGAQAGWRFSAAEALADADVYVFDAANAVQSAVQRLMSQHQPDATWGFPMVSSNGGLVFIVYFRGNVADSDHAYKALGIASALAGEEE